MKFKRSKNWNELLKHPVEKEKDKEKEKVGDRPAKLNEKTESDRELKREKKRIHFLLVEQHENFVTVVRK